MFAIATYWTKTKMARLFVAVLFVLLKVVRCVMCSDLFHVNSRTMFRPDEAAEYFGYALSLSSMGLYVGAPKAKSRTLEGISPGLVFACPMSQYNSSEATCFPLGKDDRSNRRMRSYIRKDFFKDDMWFGAVVTAVPGGILLVCAPRETMPQKKYLLANGVCYIHGKNKEQGLYPLRDPDRVEYITEGHRLEYSEYGAHAHLYYYAYGQSGMSVAVTNNNSVLIGAPGVLHWTGAVVDYKFDPSMPFSFSLSPTTNPYHTKELGPDEYFGYSVDSGTFDESGVVLYVAGAPRSRRGYGQVLLFQSSTREKDPLKIIAMLEGPQLGSYFGASICAVDIDGDGLSDLLVGAPNFARRDEALKYDQGAVFVYMSRKKDFRFVLKKAGLVMGSGESGARFGTAIADLGDVDGDGHNEIAVGAPWENGGSGAVYIYKGSENGLHSQYAQKLYAAGARSFGIAVSKGYDVDENNCNDVAIGALNSGSAYLYRSVPTIQVFTSIKLPDAVNMKQNATNFSTILCVTVPMNKSLNNVEMDMKATITVDPENNRAYILGSTNFVVKLIPGLDICDEQIIAVNNQSDLSKPILIKFDLEPTVDLDKSITLPVNMARISEDSNLQSSFLIQMLSDCGEDLVCTPWLEMTMESLNSPYIPGIDSQLGVKITVVNKAEPAYSVKLHVSLPCPPKRLLSSCSLQNLDMTCDLPAPLKRNQTAEWMVELEYAWDGIDSELNVRAALEDPLYQRNISDDSKEVVIPITPMSSYSFSGKPQPNQITNVTRDTFDKKGDIMFTHYFEVTNRGPSDYYFVGAIAYFQEDVVLAFPIEGTTLVDNSMLRYNNVASLKANTTAIFELTLRYDLSKFSNELDNQLALNVTTTMYLYLQNYQGSTPTNSTVAVTTTLVLEPKTPIWPLIVGSVAGLILLAAIILALYKFGFFSREKKEELKHLLENTATSSQEDSLSSQTNGTNSNRELLHSDSE